MYSEEGGAWFLYDFLICLYVRTLGIQGQAIFFYFFFLILLIVVDRIGYGTRMPMFKASLFWKYDKEIKNVCFEKGNEMVLKWCDECMAFGQ